MAYLLVLIFLLVVALLWSTTRIETLSKIIATGIAELIFWAPASAICLIWAVGLPAFVLLAGFAVLNLFDAVPIILRPRWWELMPVWAWLALWWCGFWATWLAASRIWRNSRSDGISS